MLNLTSLLCDTWVEGQAPFAPLTDAVTGEVIGQASSRGLDLQAALAYAREVGGPALRAMSFAERGDLIKRLSKAIYTHRDELLDLSTRSYGATRGDGKFDIDGASGTLAWYAAQAASLGDRRVLLDGEAEAIGRSARFVGQHLLVPRRGVAIHINAFNFPAWGMGEKLAACLLAGVPALVKPATSTAIVTWRIVQIWKDEGLLPPGVISLLCGSAGDLLDHVEAQDVITFTGSSDTAAAIRGHRRVVALNVPVNCEADSLNAAVLGPDAEAGEPTFEAFIADVARDMTQKAGQKCTATRRIFVPTARLDEVREALTDALSRVAVGAPDAKGVGMGPVATAQQQADVKAGIERLGVETEPWYVGGPVPETGYFVAPHLLFAAGGGDLVHRHEVFGPVATVIPWSGEASALASAVARGGGGLVASLYSDDPAWAGEALVEMAPYNGRLYWISAKVADQGPGPGTVLPNLVHGGPGKAGGGEELGGLRGLRFYQQRTAVQADRGLLDRALGRSEA